MTKEKAKRPPQLFEGSVTYGDLPEAIRALLPGYEWDNMTPTEQRAWLIRTLNHVLQGNKMYDAFAVILPVGEQGKIAPETIRKTREGAEALLPDYPRARVEPVKTLREPKA